jgi:DNA-binding transcriptional ArsR family regulator
MSTEHDGLSLDESVRAMVLLMPRLVGRAKRLPVPDALRSFDLAPRHLSLLTYVLFDGPLTVNELTAALGTTQQNMSKHLGVLADAGIVRREKAGTRVRCSIADDSVFDLCELVCGGLRRRVSELDATLAAR